MTYNDTTKNEKTISGALALVMHLLFFALLVFGVSWQKKQADSVAIVDLWSNLPSPQPKVAAPPPLPPEVKPEPPKPLPKVEPRPAPKPEPKPAVKPDIALKEKLEKERRQKELEKQKELLEKKKELEKKAREKIEAQKREEKLKAAKEKQEKERLAREQDEAIKKLAQQQAAQTAAQARMMDEYTRGIREKIKRNVVLPPNMQGNPEAQFYVVQIPGGEVLSVTLKRSSGIAAYDEAVERAIRKAQPLPPPPPGVAFSDVRELNLKFRPKE